MTPQTFGGFRGWLPGLRLDDGQTDLSLFVDVRMVDRRLKRYLGRFEGIIIWVVDSNAERALIIGRSSLQRINNTLHCGTTKFAMKFRPIVVKGVGWVGRPFCRLK